MLDSQAPSQAIKPMEGLQCIPVVVNDIARARYVLLNMSIDLWICDLNLDDLDFRRLHSESMTRNAAARILLTGTPISQHLANTLIKENRGDQFIAKPWNVLAFKRAVNTLLQTPRSPDDPAAAPPAAPPPRRIITPSGMQLRIKPSMTANLSSTPPAEEGRYQLDELIGEGGMGRVYRAYDRLLDMEVAVKLLNHEFSRDQEAINQLKEETRISLQLLHRHIVRFYNLEKRQNQFLIIMEYVPGVSLHKYMAQMPQGLVPLDLVLQIVGVMADALGYAHRKGVLHKDITPSNVLISEDGVLKLIDFGIADLMNRQRVIPDYVIGTPVYMSPEQLRGDELDARTDVYSLGVLTHQMMSGRLPNAPDPTVETLAFMPHPPLVGFPPRVGKVLEWALAFETAGRCPTVRDFNINFREACRQDYGAAIAPPEARADEPDGV